jgi:hypothetical protein
MTRILRAVWPLALAALVACDEEKVCSSDQKLCGDTCISVATDPQNCGACGNACPAGEACSDGLCRCADGRADCGGACVDVASDPDHCGACDVACADAKVCTTDAAGATACADACAQGTQTACGEACVDLEADRWNCGACGRACATNERCGGGECRADLYLACYNSNELREATAELAPAGLPLVVAPGPIGLAWLDGGLFVASTAPGGVETLTRVTFGAPAIAASPVLETSVARPGIQYLAEHDGLLFVSHSSVGTLLVAAPDGAIVDEVRLAPIDAPNPNPQGIAFAGGKAYVALNARDEVVVLDVSGLPACAAGTKAKPCTTELARVNVGPLATAGGIALPSNLAVAGGRVFVSLWNLDAYWNVPQGGTGRLAVIDVASDALDQTVSAGDVKGVVDLGAACLNPADVAVHGSTLYVTCGAFDYSGYPEVKITGAGIAPLDLSGTAPVPGAVLPMGDGAAPGKLAFCGSTGYVGDRNSGRVFRFDPTTGAPEAGVELCPASNGFAYVADLACGF